MLSHNKTTLRQLESYTERGQSCCVVNPCGSGKTEVMAEFIKRHLPGSAVVITKQKNAASYYRQRDAVFSKTVIKTYNMMLSDYKNGRLDDYDADYLMVDEAHYIGADRWNEAFMYICAKFCPVVIGFTATPQRFEDQGTDASIVSEFFGGRSAGNYSVTELQREGVFKEPEYILSLYSLDEEIESRAEKIAEADMPESRKQHLMERLSYIRSDWEENSCPAEVLKKALPGYMYKENCNRILVYVSDMNEIDRRREEVDRLIKGVFPGRTYRSFRYTYRDKESEFSAFLEEDDSYIKVLYSIDKIMETVHIDDLNIMIMLRPSVSNRIITQQFGRVNSIGNGLKPLIIDMVGNLQNMHMADAPCMNQSEKRGQEDTGKSYSYNINLSYVQKYSGIFSAIDNSFVKARLYTYKGVTDTMHTLCYIFGKDPGSVKALIKSGMDEEEAFDMARTYTPQITREVFEGVREVPDFSLTPEQMETVRKNTGTVERFIKRSGITDEDLKQDLYINMMKTVSRVDDSSRDVTHAVLVNLKNYYLKVRRSERIRAGLWEEKDLSSLPLKVSDNAYQQAVINEYRHDILPKLLNGGPDSRPVLTERERRIVIARYGLSGNDPMTYEELGRMINVTRERVRQIEAKAIRKLRRKAYTMMNHKEACEMLQLLMTEVTVSFS